MTLATAISMEHVDRYRTEMKGFDAKTKNAYLELTLQLRWRGNLEFDAKYLAKIAEVGLSFWNNKVWPRISHLFLIEEGRLYHADIERAEAPRLRVVSPELSNIRRQAAQRRTYANGHANGMQNPMQTDAKVAAYSMPDASGLHDLASDPSHTPSLSLASSASSIPLESLVESEEESREREGARADASDADRANGHANGMQNPMQTDATGDAKRPAKARLRDALSTRIPPDWTPTEFDRREARKRGFDPDVIAAAFRDVFLAKTDADGGLSPDWSAKYRTYCRREEQFAPSKQRHMPMPISGGKPEKDSWRTKLAGEIVRNRSGIDPEDEGRPIVEGVAS